MAAKLPSGKSPFDFSPQAFSYKLLLLILVLTLGVGAGLHRASPGKSASYSYTNAVSFNVPDGSSATNNGCAYWAATRYFLVDDAFTVNDLNVEFSQAHASRGQIQVKLTAPDGATRELIAPSSDANDNYFITLDGDSGGALNGGGNDTIGGTRRTVLQAALNDFEGKRARGHWTMTICDNTNAWSGSGAHPSQAFNAATLLFDGTAVTPIPLNHKQGSPVVETYFVPWPEDQVWTAFGLIFPNTCTNYATFRDNYDAAPRQPMVGFTSITITQAGTVIRYDHWENGYEVDLTYPAQNSTEVWGDGDPFNGIAPGDPDDLLVSGQTLILNDVMLSSTLGTVVDFDARDKIGVSHPISMTRSVWADGSQTMFAAADEVYPVERWGVQYYAPIGDNANLNGMFDYSGVSIIAAADGTLVDIDKNGDGVYETSGVSLAQGESTLVNDTGTGVYRRAGFRSNSGHPIQVNQITANTCAGYESRTYPLLPYDQWDSSYYLPVSTITTDTGPSADAAPTTVHLFNPNASAINVAYDVDSGYAGYANIAANSSSTLVMPVGEAARFYNVTTLPSSATNNVRDEFASQAYNLTNGSVAWAGAWTESGDDSSAANGTIYVNTTEDELRFRESSAANDSIRRTANLSGGYTSATLSFALAGSMVDASPDDDLAVQISDDGGSSWTTLATYSSANNPGGSTVSIDVSDHIASNTTLRFIMVGALETGSGDGERWDIDNVDINFSYNNPGVPGTNLFYGVASVDSEVEATGGSDDQATYDYGLTLAPEKGMSQWVIVGWAVGDDPTFLGSLAENTAPVWLTGGHPVGSPAPNAAYSVCVDDGGDGGALTDAATGRTYDRDITGIAPRAQVKVYNGGAQVVGQDQTGMQIWVCDGSDTLITAAWGADPLTATASKPALDMGYTVRSQFPWYSAKGAALQVDRNGNSLIDEGDTIRYTIRVTNTHSMNLPDVLISDVLPANLAYVANSTTLVDDGTPPPASGQVPDSGSTAFPLDEGGVTLSNLGTGAAFTLSFDAVVVPTAPFQALRTNQAQVTVGGQSITHTMTSAVQNPAVKQGSLGNFVWLDEDGDGDQDAGETGIPNVLVTVTNGSVTYTTYTDARGEYLFTGLPVGAWTVSVTAPAGLVATYDEDGTASAHASAVNLTVGEEHLTADFGYNWMQPANTNGGAGAGAIGDRVWSDGDGDGRQDPGEPGIAGVEVQLWYDADADGTIDAQYGAMTTGASGAYIFADLPAGVYEVRVATPPAGYTQTGDPDEFGALCGACDQRTTAPVLLAPGDVLVNVDFGYQPAAGQSGAIGDTLWVDADRDNSVDAGETRLPEVTVALIQDVDGDGAWDAGEAIIARTITDMNGQYLFSGLPANGGQDYLVWVNDAGHVLGDLIPTYDANGGSAPAGAIAVGSASGSVLGLSSVQNLTSGGNLNQDFAYAPTGHDAGEGLIGDTVFLDRDNDSQPDAGEGMEGVQVRLYATDGVTVLAVTTTDENGYYAFGNLPAGSYLVQVKTGTLPYSGLSNTVDPDNNGDSTSAVTLASGAANLDQDFGYRDASQPNTIGGTLWGDVNASGALEGGEAARFAGVTVILRSPAGNVIAVAASDANGDYSFTNLPDGVYTVDVVDESGVLASLWKSSGANPGADHNSQADSYGVSVSGGQVNTTADFGYYRSAAALGNLIWSDLDDDGQQETGEPGLPGIAVILEIAYPNGTVTKVKAVSDASGVYSFGGLLIDEDIHGQGSGQPAYTLSLAVPAGYMASFADQGADDALDSDGVDQGDGMVKAAVGQAPNLSQVLRGLTNGDYDFGLVYHPTSITISALTAAVQENSILLTWQTYDETEMLGFSLYRTGDADSAPLLVAQMAAKKMGKFTGAVYDYPDAAVEPGVTYTYELVVTLKDGSTLTLPPTSAALAPVPEPEPTQEPPAPVKKVYLPTVVR